MKFVLRRLQSVQGKDVLHHFIMAASRWWAVALARWRLGRVCDARGCASMLVSLELIGLCQGSMGVFTVCLIRGAKSPKELVPSHQCTCSVSQLLLLVLIPWHEPWLAPIVCCCCCRCFVFWHAHLLSMGHSMLSCMLLSEVEMFSCSLLFISTATATLTFAAQSLARASCYIP
jgi:hypothetical protein